MTMNKDVTDEKLREEFRQSCKKNIRKIPKISFVNPLVQKAFYEDVTLQKLRNEFKNDAELICGPEQEDKDPMKEGSQYRTTHSNYISKHFRDLMHAALE